MSTNIIKVDTNVVRVYVINLDVTTTSEERQLDDNGLRKTVLSCIVYCTVADL